MRVSGLLWIGAAAAAAIGGFAFWIEGVDELGEQSDRVIERVDERVDVTVGAVDRVVTVADRRVDRIDRAVDHAVDRPNARFEAEMDRLEAAIREGEISHGEAIDRAIQASIEGGRGPGTPRSAPAEEAAAANAILEEARAELQQAESEVRQLRRDDRIDQETYADTLAALARAKTRIEDAAAEADRRAD